MTNLAKFLAKHGYRMALSLVPLFFCLGHASGSLSINAIQKIDNIIYDFKLRWFMPQTRDSRIVIVDIDEKSISDMGRWPWNRQKLALLTNELVQNQQVALIGFNMVFEQPDESSGMAFLKQLSSNSSKLDTSFLSLLSDLQPALDYDAQFALSMKDKAVVLGYYFSHDKSARTNGTPPKAAKEENLSGTNVSQAVQWRGYTSNLDLLSAAAPRAGFLNTLEDDDGTLRSSGLLAGYKSDTYESFALAMYRAYADTASTLSGTADIYVPYRGFGGPNGGSYQYVSAADVLAKKLNTGELKGKIILIGSSAPGIQDLHVTPVGINFPDVEIHASVLSGLLDGRHLHKPANAVAIDTVLLGVAGLLLAVVLPALSVPGAIAFGLAVLAIPLAFNIYAFHALGLVLPLSGFLLMVFAVYLLHMSYGYFVESQAKRDLALLLGSYVPLQLVDRMLQNPNNHTMKAANKDMTVMFCDLRGFTQLGQDIPPTQLQQLLNNVFSRLSHVILQHKGTVDKYMGDCIMAFWGAPDDLPNHAELAVLAGLEIIKEVKNINADHKTKFMPLVRIGIGINTGVMCVGDMGSSVRRNYTVVGDAVNTASRFESLTKNYQLDLLVGLPTKIAAPMFDWQIVDTVKLQGKSEALILYTLHIERQTK